MVETCPDAPISQGGEGAGGEESTELIFCIPCQPTLDERTMLPPGDKHRATMWMEKAGDTGSLLTELFKGVPTATSDPTFLFLHAKLGLDGSRNVKKDF